MQTLDVGRYTVVVLPEASGLCAWHLAQGTPEWE